jgi:hypothetical protein
MLLDVAVDGWGLKVSDCLMQWLYMCAGPSTGCSVPQVGMGLEDSEWKGLGRSHAGVFCSTIIITLFLI